MRRITWHITHKVHDTKSAQILQKQDWNSTWVIMKTMSPPSHDHDFVATRALRNMLHEMYTELLRCM